MKSEKLTIRVTSKEREKLEEKAKAVNKNVSEFIRLKIFGKKDNDYNLIFKQLSSLQDGQQQQLEYLETISLQSKKDLVKNSKSKIRK